MGETAKEPTPCGRVILDRLAELSLSIAEIERRTPLTKNTILNVIYGPRLPQRKTIGILAEVLEIPVETLTRSQGISTASNEAPPVLVGHASFGDWLFRWNNKLLWVSVLGSATTGYFLSQDLRDTASSAIQGTVVQGTQLAVILVLLGLLPKFWIAPDIYESASRPLKVATKAARDFRRYWGAVWLFWVFLYLAITVTAYLECLPVPIGEMPPEFKTRLALFVLDFLQNSGTVLLFLCYEVMARPTIKDDLSRKQVLPTEAWFALVALLTLAEAFFLWNGHWAFQQWFGWLSGFGQGMALALLVGRFDSKYVDPPAITIGLLYLYAVIQGAWPVFRYEPELMLVLTFLALVLKCLLFLFVSWLFDSDVILFYLGRMRKLDQTVRQDRVEFLHRYRDQALRDDPSEAGSAGTGH